MALPLELNQIQSPQDMAMNRDRQRSAMQGLLGGGQMLNQGGGQVNPMQTGFADQPPSQWNIPTSTYSDVVQPRNAGPDEMAQKAAFMQNRGDRDARMRSVMGTGIRPPVMANARPEMSDDEQQERFKMARLAQMQPQSGFDPQMMRNTQMAMQRPGLGLGRMNNPNMNSDQLRPESMDRMNDSRQQQMMRDRSMGQSLNQTPGQVPVPNQLPMGQLPSGQANPKMGSVRQRLNPLSQRNRASFAGQGLTDPMARKRSIRMV